MSDVSPIASYPTPRVDSARAMARYESTARPEPTSVRGGEDRVEVSAVSTYLAKLRLLPAVRHDLVRTIQEEIASGGYDSPEKLNAAIDEMISDM